MYCIVYIYLIMLLFLAQCGYSVMYIPYDLEAVKDDLIWYTNQLEKYLEYHNDTSNQRHLSSHQMLQIWFPLEKKNHYVLQLHQYTEWYGIHFHFQSILSTYVCTFFINPSNCGTTYEMWIFTIHSFHFLSHFEVIFLWPFGNFFEPLFFSK